MNTETNKAKAISAELLELYLKNKLEEMKKIGKKQEETGRNGNKIFKCWLIHCVFAGPQSGRPT